MYNSYGALELKMSYQKNMAKATLIVTLSIATIVVLFLVTTSKTIESEPPETDYIKPPPESTPIPRIIYERTSISVRRPSLDYNQFTIPVPIIDSLLGEEDDSVKIVSSDKFYPVGSEIGEEIPITFENTGYQGGYGDGEPSLDSFQIVEIYPEIIYEHKSPYPKFAKLAGLEGIVWIKSLIGKEGDVIRAIVAKTSDIVGLDEAALSDALLYKYKPGIQSGHPIKVWVTYKVEYRLY